MKRKTMTMTMKIRKRTNKENDVKVEELGNIYFYDPEEEDQFFNEDKNNDEDDLEEYLDLKEPMNSQE